MRYLVIDKRQRLKEPGYTSYAINRLKDEFEQIKADYLFAYTDEIEINLEDEIAIKVNGEDIRNFTHIILRGHNLSKPWEYETKRIIADYIAQYNKTHADKKTFLQNIKALQTIASYDKLWIQKMCIENDLPTIPSYYKTSAQEYETIPYPYILKDFTGENDVRNINGVDKIKKNVYLINSKEDLYQENLKNKDITRYFAQKFVPTGVDMRIFVSNMMAVAGWERKATEGFMTVNKGIYTAIDLNSNIDIKNLSEKVAKVFQADFIAVDLMRDTNGKLLILEISLNPGFHAYETKVTGEKVNIAKTIIQSFGK